MGVKGKSNLETANQAVRALFDQYFSLEDQGVHTRFARDVTLDAYQTEMPAAAILGTVQEWLGDKEITNLEAFSQTIKLQTYHLTVDLDRLLVDKGDNSGVIGDVLGRQLAEHQRVANEKIVFDKLVSNSGNGPNAYDGLSLFSTARVMGSTTGVTNKTTSALSFSTYETAWNTMTEYVHPSGEPMNVTPTTLVVGPKNRQLALEIANADMRITTAGNTSIGGAASINNVFRGDVDVVIWNRLQGTYDDYWYLLDESKPDKPMGLGNGRDWELFGLLDMTDHDRFYRDKYVWSIEADKVPFASAPLYAYAGIVS